MSARLRVGLCSLLTEGVVISLNKCGICSVDDLLACDLERVASSSGLVPSLLHSIQHTFSFQAGPLDCGEAGNCCLSVGCSSIDELLDGGMWSGEVLELWGPAASGKTQLCHALTASVVGGTGHSVAYICASCDFSPARLRQLLLSQQVKEAELPAAMEKARVFRVHDVFKLLACLHQLHAGISQQVDTYHANLGLVVIDPVTLYLSPLLGCRQGHTMLGRVGGVLKDMAYQHRLAVVCVNNVVADMSRGRGGGGGGVKAALGQLWSTVPSMRLQLSFARPYGHQEQHPTPQRSYSGDVPATPTIARLLTVSMATRENTGSNQAIFTITDSGLLPP